MHFLWFALAVLVTCFCGPTTLTCCILLAIRRWFLRPTIVSGRVCLRALRTRSAAALRVIALSTRLGAALSVTTLGHFVVAIPGGTWFLGCTVLATRFRGALIRAAILFRSLPHSTFWIWCLAFASRGCFALILRSACFFRTLIGVTILVPSLRACTSVRRRPSLTIGGARLRGIFSTAVLIR